MSREDAIVKLEAFLKIGGLYIITSEHACGGGIHPNLPNFNRYKCEMFPTPVRHHNHFVKHKVTRLEGPNDRGLYVAMSDEGDYTIGQPEELLARLREYQQA